MEASACFQLNMEMLGDCPPSVFSIPRKVYYRLSFIYDDAFNCNQPGTVTRAVRHTQRMGSVLSCTGCNFYSRSLLSLPHYGFEDSVHHNADALPLRHCGRHQINIRYKNKQQRQINIDTEI